MRPRIGLSVMPLETRHERTLTLEAFRPMLDRST